MVLFDVLLTGQTIFVNQTRLSLKLGGYYKLNNYKLLNILRILEN